MTTTLAALTALCRQDLRDPVPTAPDEPTFSNAEIYALIAQGIDAIGVFYPKEVVGSVTIVANTYSYALPSGVSYPYRVDLYDASGTYLTTLDESPGGNPNAGWSIHGGTLYIPHTTWTAGYTLQLWGYGGWAYISSSSASSASTDLDQSGLWALRVFVRVNAYKHLIADRAKFAQYQQQPGVQDATLAGMLALGSQARQEWKDVQRDLGRMRKTG